MHKGLERYAYILLATGLALYLVSRAIYVPFVNDESETFLFFIQTGDFVPWISSHWVANNHFLNTMLSWISYQFFGLDEWTLRLASLFSFVLFLVYLYKTGLLVKHRVLRWILWLSILGAHYFIEFFAYCRGYAMSNAFLLAAIYHLIKACKKPGRLSGEMWLSFLFMTAALLANLNLLYSYAIWLTFAYVLTQSPPPKRDPSLLFWAALVPLCYSLTIAVKLKIHDQLYIGTPYGMESSYKIILEAILPGFVIPALYYFYFIGILALLLVGYYFYRSRTQWSDSLPLNVFLIFISVNLLISFGTAVLMGLKLPIARTGSYWYMLAVITLVLVLDRVKNESWGRFFWVTAIPLLFIPLNFVRLANLHVSSDKAWASEQIPEAFYNYLVQRDTSSSFPSTLSAGSSFYSHNWAMLNLQKKRDVNVCQNYVGREMISDYQIIKTEDFPSFAGTYVENISDRYSGLSVISRYKPMSRQTILEADSPVFENDNPSFYQIMQCRVDSLQGLPLQFDYTVDQHTKESLFTGLLTVIFKNARDEHIAYEQVNISHHKTEWGKEPLRVSIYFDRVPLEAISVESYIWNFNEQKYSLLQAHVSMHLLK
ncbi:MAG TPA: hypothetical protein DCG19_12900 [Cryomorphaceae bacterium]|nr:hypothetical protein [Owenweeksia sp.]MBF99155.1 hypothetical protein [Owenweeksia sp.]HAD98301.1 hypothetical protein [Cryomorphaceae bacterium]|tara:strand:- start:19445 stop:21241 length:1797 start_codon:yes stop_codon:yes gene_type:complete